MRGLFLIVAVSFLLACAYKAAQTLHSVAHTQNKTKVIVEQILDAE